MFNLEEFKEELAEMSYADRYQAYEDRIDELEVLQEEIEDAINDICAIRDLDMREHDTKVWQNISQSVQQMIADGKLPQITVDEMNNTFILSTIDGIIKVTTEPVDDSYWYIAIEPEFIASKNKRQKLLSRLAAKLNITSTPENQELITNVNETELIDNLKSILSNLCDELDLGNDEDIQNDRTNTSAPTRIAELVDLDPLFNEAAKFIISSGNFTISGLQRIFLIGFNRASRIMEQLEQAGIVGPLDAYHRRQILVELDELKQLETD